MMMEKTTSLMFSPQNCFQNFSLKVIDKYFKYYQLLFLNFIIHVPFKIINASFNQNF